MTNFDPYLIIFESFDKKLDDVAEDIREIKQDIKAHRAELDKDLLNIKQEQAKCSSYWGMVGKTLKWGGGAGSVILSALAAVFGFKHDQP